MLSASSFTSVNAGFSSITPCGIVDLLFKLHNTDTDALAIAITVAITRTASLIFFTISTDKANLCVSISMPTDRHPSSDAYMQNLPEQLPMSITAVFVGCTPSMAWESMVHVTWSEAGARSEE
jgi:hypothetical protein